MRSKLIERVDGKDGPQRTYAVVLDTGDEAVSVLTRFAKEQKLAGSHFTAIGAFSDAVLGYFDWQIREYKKNPVDEQVEVLSLIGDIAVESGEPTLHAHVVVGKRDGAAHGGHLLKAHVRPTLEVMLTEEPIALQKRHDPETGLALIRL